jgi:hypothetical protein
MQVHHWHVQPSTSTDSIIISNNIAELDGIQPLDDTTVVDANFSEWCIAGSVIQDTHCLGRATVCVAGTT